jgi:hypothetical protein
MYENQLEVIDSFIADRARCELPWPVSHDHNRSRGIGIGIRRPLAGFIIHFGINDSHTVVKMNGSQ